MKRALVVAVVLFVVVVAGMSGYARFVKEKLRQAEAVPTAPAQERETQYITHIDAKHYYRDGMHTVAGEIIMPTPCDLLKADAVVKESAPEQVTIDLTIINNTQGVCAQLVTPQRFKVSFKGGADTDAKIDATLNGKPVTLNLIEAGPDETPDDFEVLITD